jgi:hypothetical protein
MRIKKKPVRPEKRDKKIVVHLVLCPWSKLYLQDLYCKSCSYFEGEGGDFVLCTYGDAPAERDPSRERLADDLASVGMGEGRAPSRPGSPLLETLASKRRDKSEESSGGAVVRELKRELSSRRLRGDLGD